MARATARVSQVRPSCSTPPRHVILSNTLPPPYNVPESAPFYLPTTPKKNITHEKSGCYTSPPPIAVPATAPSRRPRFTRWTRRRRHRRRGAHTERRCREGGGRTCATTSPPCPASSAVHDDAWGSLPSQPIDGSRSCSCSRATTTAPCTLPDSSHLL